MVSFDGGGLQTKSMTSQRNRAAHKMADMRYYGNVMTTTRWRLYVTMEITQKKRLQSRQRSSVYDCTVEDVEYIYNKFSLYTELVIDVFYIFNSTVVD